MTLASSNRRNALRAFALLAGVIGAPTACALNLAGMPTGGAGGSASASTSTSTSPSSSTSSGGDGGASGSTSTSTSGSTGTGGAAPLCDVGMMSSCYDGSPGTANVGACKSGMHLCMPDGSSFGACMNQVLPSAENCLEPADEDCDGKALGCTGSTLNSGSSGMSPTDEVIFAVATDPSGNLFVGGVNGATPSAGKGFAMASGTGSVVKFLKNGTMSWSASIKSSVASSYSVVRGLATDKQGNVFVVGELQGTTSGGTINVVNAGGVDIFLAKLDPTGKTIWAKAFGNSADQYGNSVAVDTAGNVFITGRMVGAVDFGGGAPGVSAGAGDNLFVAKLDTDGKHVWSNAFGDDSDQIGYGVATTPDGDVVVTGSLVGAIDFGGGVSFPSAGNTDIFVAKLASANGAGMWGHHYGDDQDQSGNGVAVGADSGVVITGGMVGKFNFGGGDLDAKSKTNVFVAKLRADGTHQWSHDYGSNNDNQVGYGVAVDPALNILVVGYLKGTLSFGGGTPTLTDSANANSGNTDMFVAKLSADGVGVWARSFGDVNDQTAWAVTADPVSNVFVGGTYEGTVNLPPSITATGSYDAFWAELAP